jgi:hypothetical protein
MTRDGRRPGHGAAKAGHLVLMVSRRLCAARTVERLIEPILTDIAIERRDALDDGRRWQARWISVRGYAGLCTAMALHGTRACRNALKPDEGATRVLGFSAGAFVIVTFALVLPPLLGGGPHARHMNLGLYLIPQAIPLSVPLAVSFGIACGWFRHAASAATLGWIVILGMLGSASGLATMEWLIPAANQAFRVTVTRLVAPAVVHVPRGLNERSLSELASLLREPSASGSLADAKAKWAVIDQMAATGGPFDRERVRRQFHMRVALCFATGALSLLGVAIGRCIRRRNLARSVFTAAVVLYIVAFFTVAAGSRLSPAVSPWLPNAAAVLISLLLLGSKSIRGASA